MKKLITDYSYSGGELRLNNLEITPEQLNWVANIDRGIVLFDGSERHNFELLLDDGDTVLTIPFVPEKWEDTDKFQIYYDDLDYGVDVNFPASLPVTQSGTWNVGVNNFPVIQEIFNDADLLVIRDTGLYRGRTAKMFGVLGGRATFVNTTAFHDLCEFLTNSAGQENFTPVTTNDTLEIVSSSANDIAAGSGTRTVKVLYLDNAGALTLSPDIILNGTTPVAAGFTASAVLSMFATSGGGFVSAGNIDLKKVGAATIYERITAGGNQSISGRFTVPVGYTGYLLNGHAAAINQTMDVRLRTQSFDGVFNSQYLFKARAFLASGQSIAMELPYTKVPELATIKVSAIPGATTGNPRVDASFTVLLIENE